jgi:hypothetical protein
MFHDGITQQNDIEIGFQVAVHQGFVQLSRGLPLGLMGLWFVGFKRVFAIALVQFLYNYF